MRAARARHPSAPTPPLRGNTRAREEHLRILARQLRYGGILLDGDGENSIECTRRLPDFLRP